jgi:CRISPR/Cas system-associated exonuclease Cas4 (RecB family)
MAALTHVSASSITLFSECERKWYYRYILGVKGETSDAMRRGTEIHEELEHFLNTGEFKTADTTAVKIAETGVPHLESVNRVIAVEDSLEGYPLAKNLGVQFKGFIDVLAEEDEHTVHILDHKTTSDLKYAKTPAQLAQNIQLIIYAKHLLDNKPEYTHALLTHVYYTTKKPFQSKRVDVRLARAEVDEAFKDVESQVAKMLTAAEQTMEFTNKNSKYCFAYNKRCEHHAACFTTTQQRLDKPMSKEQEARLAFLRGEIPSAVITEQQPTAIDPGPAPAIDPGPAPAIDPGPVAAIDPGAEKCFIFVGVMPLGGRMILSHLSDALEPLMQQVCTEMKVSHIALAPYAAGYARLSALIAEKGIPAGNWYIDAQSQLYSRISDDLYAAADTVFVKG